MKKLLLIFSLICFNIEAREGNSLSLFYGRATIDKLISIPSKTLGSTNLNYTNTYSAAIQYNHYYKSFFNKRLHIHWVLNFNRHLEKRVNKDFNEYAAGFSLAWTLFPWSNYLPTRFSVVEGISYAEEILYAEKFDRSNKDTHRFLNLLIIDLLFNLPSYPKWRFGSRVHHRSGAFGLYNGVWGGSNIPGIVIEYVF